MSVVCHATSVAGQCHVVVLDKALILDVLLCDEARKLRGREVRSDSLFMDRGLRYVHEASAIHLETSRFKNLRHSPSSP